MISAAVAVMVHLRYQIGTQSAEMVTMAALFAPSLVHSSSSLTFIHSPSSYSSSSLLNCALFSLPSGPRSIIRRGLRCCCCCCWKQFTFLSLCRFSLSFLLSLCWILPFSYFTLFFGFIPPFFPILPFESRRKSPPGGEVRCCYPRGTTSAE